MRYRRNYVLNYYQKLNHITSIFPVLQARTTNPSARSKLHTDSLTGLTLTKVYNTVQHSYYYIWFGNVFNGFKILMIGLEHKSIFIL